MNLIKVQNRIEFIQDKMDTLQEKLDKASPDQLDSIYAKLENYESELEELNIVANDMSIHLDEYYGEH